MYTPDGSSISHDLENTANVRYSVTDFMFGLPFSVDNSVHIWRQSEKQTALTVFTRMRTFQKKHTRTHTHLTALFLGLPGWAGTRKVKPIWILLKQQTVSGCGISWAICKSAPHSRQITMPAPHHSVFYRLDEMGGQTRERCLFSHV